MASVLELITSNIKLLVVVTLAFIWYFYRKFNEGPKEETPTQNEEEDSFDCEVCGKKSKENHGCHNCAIDACGDCSVYFEDAVINICKKCIDKEYPRKAEIIKEEPIADVGISEDYAKQLEEELE